MKNIRSKGGQFACALAVVLSLGCEMEPAIVSVDELGGNVPDQSASLVSQELDGKYDWPVAAGLWVVNRPTGIAAVRQLSPGSLGERFAEIELQRQAKIEKAEASGKPAPWEVDAHKVAPEQRVWFQELVEEAKNEIKEQLVVQLPRHVKQRNGEPTPNRQLGYEVQLDYVGRYMVVLNDSLHVCRLPWRDYYASPDLPPQESDEPGTPDTFDRIELPNATQESPVLAEFYGDEANLIAAKGKHLYTIDCDKKEIVASMDVGNPIVHLSVAQETGDAIIVDSVGKIYLLNQLMKRITSVGTCDLELPMPAISPEAARIATYSESNAGRIYKINDLTVVEQFDVDLADAGTPKAIRSGRIYDYWIETNTVFCRPNYPRQAGGDRKTTRAGFYWELQDVIGIHNGTNHSEFCISTAPTKSDADGAETRWMGVDVVLGNHDFSTPLQLPDLTGRQLSSSGTGSRVCIASEDAIRCYYRIGNYTLGVLGLQNAARDLSWTGKFDALETLAKLVSELPVDRHGRRPQQLYGELINGTGLLWKDAAASRDNKENDEESREQARKACKKLEAWADGNSTFALECKMKFHAYKAWASRGNGYSHTVSEDGWDVFEKENTNAMKIWQTIESRDDVSAESYSVYIQLARDTGLEYSDVSETLAKAMDRYPVDDAFHHDMMYWLLEKWGGKRGSSAAYAAAVADAIGGPRGDFIYSRLIALVAPNYPTGFFEYAQVDRNRVLRGIREGMRTNYWQHESTISSILLVVKSIATSNGSQISEDYTNRANAVCVELADYYKQRYPMPASFATSDTNQRLLGRYLPR